MPNTSWGRCIPEFVTVSTVPHGPVQHSVRLVVVDEQLPGRVPAEFPPQLDRDLLEVAQRVRADRDVDRRRRLGPAFDRVDEVDVVVVALEEMDFVGADLRLQQRLGMGVHRPAVHVDPALGAEEHHAVAVAALLQGMLPGGAVVHVDQRHAVGVAVLDLPARGAVGQHVLGENARAFDLRRPAQFGAVSPLGDVEVVDAPVADHAHAIVGDAVPDAVASPSRVQGRQRW